MTPQRHALLKMFLKVWLVILLLPLAATIVTGFIPLALAGFSPESYSFSTIRYGFYRTALWLIPTAFLAILYYATRPGRNITPFGN